MADLTAGRRLTDRELHVLQLMAEGYSSKEIAAKIHVSQKTVEFHRASLSKSLNARNAIDCVVIAIRLGIVRVPGITVVAETLEAAYQITDEGHEFLRQVAAK